MFSILANGVAWVVAIGLAVVIFMLVSAALGALIGKTLALVKRKPRGPVELREMTDSAPKTGVL
jgi:hypothetical protein